MPTKISRYPQEPDGSPMSIIAGVLTDLAGNNGTRAAVPLGPDNTPISTVGLVLLDKDGAYVDVTALGAGAGAGAGASSGPFVSLTTYLAPSRTPFVTDDLPAFNAALAAIKALQVGDAGVPTLYIPAGRYYCSGPINLHVSCRIIGGGVANGSNGTLIRFAPNSDGIIVNHSNTDGNGLGTQGNAGGTIIESLSLWGGSFTVNASGAPVSYSAGGSASGHGLRIRGAFVKAEDIFVAFFGQDAFHINASAGSGGATEGNANSFYLERCQAIYNGRYGYLFNGTDVNAGTTMACSAISNAGCGFVEYSFLGNTHIQPHARDNGGTDPTGCNNPVGVASYGGLTYYARADKLTQASTTVPGTDSTVWIPRFILGGKPWVTGLTWVLPGAYATNPANLNGRNVFIGCYGEAGQARIQAFTPTIFLGGLVEELQFDSQSTAVWLHQGRYGSFGTKSIDLDRDANGWGVSAGIFSDELIRMDNVDSSYFAFKRLGTNMTFEQNGSGVIFYLNGNGIELSSGKAYRINGLQVVGAQGAAVAADATDLATALTLVNQLKARMRTHGLIA